MTALAILDLRETAVFVLVCVIYALFRLLVVCFTHEKLRLIIGQNLFRDNL